MKPPILAFGPVCAGVGARERHLSSVPTRAGGVAFLAVLTLAACSGPRVADERTPFRDARAVAFDPAGRAYVVDGDLGLCRATAAAWACVNGSGDVRLTDPVALDAHDGLTVLVADRAGRLVRFDRAGVVRDVLVPPPQSSRTDAPASFAPVGVLRDALGRTLALDPAVGVVRWDAARQFAVLVPPERLPRGARALGRDGEGFAVLADEGLARYDAFGTRIGWRQLSSDVRTLASAAGAIYGVYDGGVGPLAPATVTFAPPPGTGVLVGAAFDGRRWCWLTRTALACAR